MIKKTLGGDRLGAGNKQKVYMHGYERSTQDLSYVFRSTMACGTLVPFMKEIAQPADSFDIDLRAEVMTHPTIGPLFGSYKVQLDIFQCPIRLYQAQLHNNGLNIGLNMSQIKLPVIEMIANNTQTYQLEDYNDIDNFQVNPSSILAYLGIRGIGLNNDSTAPDEAYRHFNAIPFLSYWDIYKNYYANKQEEEGVMIHTEPVNQQANVNRIMDATTGVTIDQGIGMANPVRVMTGTVIEVHTISGTQDLSQIMIAAGNSMPVANMRGLLSLASVVSFTAGSKYTLVSTGDWGNFFYWDYSSQVIASTREIELLRFPLSNIDEMREQILLHNPANPFIIKNFGATALPPYGNILKRSTDTYNQSLQMSQEGLAIKTYNSDLLNNWLNTEWIDGANGIAAVTSVDTSSGSFTMDTLNLSKKVYDMLNRIAMSGGSYDDWIDTVYAERKFTIATTPIYHGGLIKELVFEEVVSNAETGTQPLGTLAGRGRLSNKNKGGHVTIKVDEPSYIIGIVSLTPRLDYSQGNDWDTTLMTLDDIHKPALDEIGFQELLTERMAWWDTQWNTDTLPHRWVTPSAGKQPAWINYMTNINRVRGNFAVQGNEMFMTLNRSYQPTTDPDGKISIADVTTYIDPRIYNQIFAETELDAQNFWVQIAVDMNVRRKISARVMPNL